MTDYAMFTDQGNAMVHRIVEAGLKLKTTDPIERVWDWAYRELEKLATADQFEEATDTAVRDAVYERLVLR